MSSSKQRRVTRGARLRVDTTVVETNIHYPTDSSLLADGVRVFDPDDAASGGARRHRHDSFISRPAMQSVRAVQSVGA